MVCLNTFTALTGCSADIYRYMKMISDAHKAGVNICSPYKENVTDHEAMPNETRKARKSELCEAWLRVHAAQVGDLMPDDNKIVLPRIPRKLY